MYMEGDVPVSVGGSNNSWGGDGGWWVLIILFALFGWGGNGFSNGAGGASNNYVLASDFAITERKLDSIANGICDSTYALNNGIMTQGYETRNAISGLSSQMASCCCNIEKGLMENKYAYAQGVNAIQNTLCLNTRDIIDNQNANYRAIHDEIVANKLEDKNAIIAAQQNEINSLRLKASQEAQNSYLLNHLVPPPVPAYVVPNPNCCNQGCNGCFGY